jgi:hypothetical protein
MKHEQILAQSNAAYRQWAKQWREYAKINSKFEMKPFTDFENKGIGKAVLCVANGYSFEENIETIKKYKDNVDILCCDKTLGSLLDNGITPTYCMVCDANVDYKKYLEPWKDKVKDVILFNNVCGNIEWPEKAKWKDTYFFVNKDIINSHLEFSKLSGCNNFIPAGTNVSNAMVILLTQSDNEGRKNYFGYDKIILTGFDYSWKHGGKYYAFDSSGGGKINFMSHSYLILPSGAYGYTSGNLHFSCQWLLTYIRTFNLPIVQTAKDSLLQFGRVGKLEEQMQYEFQSYNSSIVKAYIKELKDLKYKQNSIKTELMQIGRDHWYAHLSTI